MVNWNVASYRARAQRFDGIPSTPIDLETSIYRDSRASRTSSWDRVILSTATRGGGEVSVGLRQRDLVVKME